ncbi:hypothetical protein KAZ01_03565, partial [Candidatus Gracilibacteria bacterium]|nr:hypothetical protein [Candidatus Gracilibacteria bacterium]
MSKTTFVKIENYTDSYDTDKNTPLIGKTTEKKGLKKSTKAKILGVLVGVTSGSIIGNKAIAENPDYKGLPTDTIKQEEISTASQALPDTIEFGGKKVKVVYEADNGQIESDNSKGKQKLTTKEELFSLGHLNEIYTEMWQEILPEEQLKILYYFNIGRQNNLDQKQIVKLAKNLTKYFYYIQNSINYIQNPVGNYKGGPSKKVIGEDIEKIIPSVGTIFSEKGKQLDNIVYEIEQKGLEESKKGLEESKKGLEESKKGLEESKKSLI